MLRKTIMITLVAALFYGCQKPEDRLLDGIKNKDTQLILKALEEGVDPNFKLYKIPLPAGSMHYDAKLGSVDGEDYQGTPILYWAILEDNEAVFEKLIEKGADINYKFTPSAIGTDFSDLTPLMLAVITSERLKYAEKLIKSGANHTIASDIQGSKRLPFELAVIEKDPSTIDLFLNHGADPNQKNSEGLPIFYLAMDGPDFSTIDLLVKKGANLNLVNSDGMSPIFWAIQTKNEPLVEYLLSKYVNIEGKYKGMDALEFAKRYGTERIEIMLTGRFMELSEEGGC